jgi:hypothetical protein
LLHAHLVGGARGDNADGGCVSGGCGVERLATCFAGIV